MRKAIKVGLCIYILIYILTEVVEYFWGVSFILLNLYLFATWLSLCLVGAIELLLLFKKRYRNKSHYISTTIIVAAVTSTFLYSTYKRDATTDKQGAHYPHLVAKEVIKDTFDPVIRLHMNDDGEYYLRYMILNEYTARGKYIWKGDTIYLKPQGFPHSEVNFTFGIIQNDVPLGQHTTNYLYLYRDKERTDKPDQVLRLWKRLVE